MPKINSGFLCCRVTQNRTISNRGAKNRVEIQSPWFRLGKGLGVSEFPEIAFVSRSFDCERLNVSRLMPVLLQIVIALAVSVSAFETCAAQLNVRLLFDSNWETRMNSLATAAGVTNFDASERIVIRNNIESQLNTMFGNFNVNFSQSNPGGSFSTIDFGSNTGALGQAPLDFMNLSVVQTAQVNPANFGFILDEFTGSSNRSLQITQISTALSGTAGHELGHSLGLHHHNSYGTAGISPATYNNTMFLQNNHVMATGPTGLGETGRETERTFSKWSNLLLEATGGAVVGLHGTTGTAIATTVLQEQDFTAADVGGTLLTAQALILSQMPISSLAAANIASSIETGTDVDLFSFTMTGAGTVTAETRSSSFYGNSIDSVLRILDSNGNLVFGDDNILYSSNGFQFGTGTNQSDETYLINVPLTSAGTYFLEVTSFSNTDTGNYNFVIGLAMAIPEPCSLAICTLLGSAVFLQHRKKR